MVPAGQSARRAGARSLDAYGPVVIAAATMAALGLWGLARFSAMGNDESATRWAARLSLPGLGHLLVHLDVVHGLYYLLMHGWMVLGTSPTIMRVPSVIAMTAAVAMTVILGRRLTGSGWAGLLAGLIVALTPAISYYGQTARSYALVFACVIGQTLALLRAMAAENSGPADNSGPAQAGEAAGAARTRVAGRWVAYGALVALGGYLNELSLLVLAAHAVTVLLARYGRRAVTHWAIAAAAGAVAVTPVVVLSARESGAVYWIPRPSAAALGLLFRDYFGMAAGASALIVGCAVVALLPPFGARAEPAGWRHGGFSVPSVAAPLLVLPAGLLILESLVARPFYVDRYVLFGEAGAALLAAAGACRIGQWLAGPGRRRTLVWVPGAIVCVCALLLQIGAQQFVRTPASRTFNYGGPARYLAARAQPGDGVLFLGSFYRTVRLGYPGDFARTRDFAMAVSPVTSGTFQGVDKPFPVIRQLMLARQRIWVVGKSPLVPLPAGLMTAESRVLRHRYSLVSHRRFRGVVVTFWLRR